MPFLRQSTSQIIRFGPCLDMTDGVTEETALTLAQADMRLSKDGAAFAQKNAAGNATHDSDGWYSTTLNATDTDTVGELRLNVHQPANMLPVWERWWVLEEAIYDALFGAAAAGFNSSGLVTLAAVTHTGAVIPTVSVLTGHTAQTGDSFARLGAPAGASVSADVAAVKVDTAAILIDTTGLNGDAMRGTDGAYTGTPPTTGAIADAVWDELRSAHVISGSFGQGVASVQGNVTGSVGSLVGHTVQTGDSYARLGAPAGASVSADIAAVKADTAATLIDTAEIGVAGAGLTNINLPNQTMDIVGNITGNLSGSVGSVTGSVGSVVAAVTVGTINTDAVDSVALATSAVTEITGGVWDAARSSYITAGSFGESHYGFVNGQAQTGTLSTTTMTTDLTEATTDHYLGRTIVFLGGALHGQATDVTAYSGTNGQLTFSALTEAPLNGQRFILV